MSSFSSTMSSVQLNDDTNIKSQLTSNPNGESELPEVLLNYSRYNINIKYTNNNTLNNLLNCCLP